MAYRTYSGIGSRQTPPSVIEQMITIARRLAAIHYTLRSGHALGADRAFEYGTGKFKEIFMANGQIPDKAYSIAREHHPAWHRCSPFAKKLHARNSQIVLGVLCTDPVHFVIAWTKDGAATGGTGQALRLAADRNIPVFNLYHGDDVINLEFHIDTLEQRHARQE